MQQAGSGVGIHEIELFRLGLQPQVSSQDREENGIRPALFHVKQVTGSNVVGRVDRSADELLGFLQIVCSSGQQPGVKKRIHRQAAASAGPVVFLRTGVCGGAGGTVVDEAEQCQPAVV